MQEQNSEKVVSLTVRASRVTANVLKSADKACRSAQKNKARCVSVFRILIPKKRTTRPSTPSASWPRKHSG